MARNLRSCMQPWRMLALSLLLIMTGSIAAPATVQASTTAPPVPAGQARIWFYRDWLPSESLNLANIEVNGSYFASVANGGVFYRDVAPGLYHIAPVSFVANPAQATTVNLVPGQQVFVKIVSLDSWGADTTAAKNIARDAFWAWLIPPAVAQAEIARAHS
jgi:hypothetical protein